MVKRLIFIQIAWILSPEITKGTNYASTHNSQVTECVGTSYLLTRDLTDASPLMLSKGLGIEMSIAYTVATRPDAYVEIQNIISNGDTIRIGQSTALEIIDSCKFNPVQGSFLYSSQSPIEILLKFSDSNLSINSQGTWLAEKSNSGFKIIPIEGKLMIRGTSFTPGELILISPNFTAIKSEIEIDLILLLQTSKLVNLFTNPLLRKNHILSAAQVQSLRMKKKYNAFVGDMSEAQKLRLWSFNPNKDSK